jgi:N-acetyl-anhydromuramyl-L-alanine amidase AmpD
MTTPPRRMLAVLAIAAALSAAPVGSEETLPDWIIDRPIAFGEERVELMKAYAADHYGMDGITIVPRMIVIHWTGGSSLEAAWKNFNRAKLTGRPFLQKYGKVNVSAHYLVGRNGKVTKLMPDTMMARHAIGLNHCSIGIENVGQGNLTKKQLLANTKLVEYLAGRYDTIGYLIGHYEYRKFEGTSLFIEKYDAYRNKKKDPGKDFMGKLRKQLEARGVNLLGPPTP